MSDAIVILGTGLAGYNLAREIRKLNKEVQLTLVSHDDGTFYSKPMLSNALAKNKSAADLAMSDAAKMSADLNASILTEMEVVSINIETKSITLSNADEIRYSKLVLALGASPIQLPIKGTASDDVLVVNNLQDYSRFRHQLDDKDPKKTSVAIIGPGLIGCEFANDLCSQHINVHVIGPDATPLNPLLTEQAGKVLQKKLEAIGVNWHLGTVVDQINHKGSKKDSNYDLILKNGTSIQADIVLSAIGLRANIELARQAGIETDIAIKTNTFLQTNIDDVYALGDCAQVDGHFLPFIMPLMNAARALAATLCDDENEKTAVKYPAMPVLVKTPAYPIVVAPPQRDQKGEWIIEQDGESVNAQYRDGDSLLGFSLSGDAVSEKQALTKLLPVVI